MKSNEKTQNKMKAIMIDSVTLHCTTADTAKLNKSEILLERISKAKPVKTLAKKRIPTWKIKPGMELGVKVTLRGKKAADLLKELVGGVQEFKEKQFNPGSFAFGIKEYIQVPSISYQRDIGMMGFEVMVALKRAGFRVSKRRKFPAKIGSSHRITKKETIEFFKINFGINIKE